LPLANPREKKDRLDFGRAKKKSQREAGSARRLSCLVTKVRR
jgi:hypothetical protein